MEILWFLLITNEIVGYMAGGAGHEVGRPVLVVEPQLPVQDKLQKLVKPEKKTLIPCVQEVCPFLYSKS